VNLAYEINLSSHFLQLSSTDIQLFPQSTLNRYNLVGSLSDYSIQLLDDNQTVVENYIVSGNQLNIDLTGLSVGQYFVKATSISFPNLEIQIQVERD